MYLNVTQEKLSILNEEQVAYSVNNIVQIPCSPSEAASGDYLFLALNCPVTGQADINDISYGIDFTARNSIYVNKTGIYFPTFLLVYFIIISSPHYF